MKKTKKPLALLLAFVLAASLAGGHFVTANAEEESAPATVAETSVESGEESIESSALETTGATGGGSLSVEASSEADAGAEAATGEQAETSSAAESSVEELPQGTTAEADEAGTAETSGSEGQQLETASRTFEQTLDSGIVVTVEAPEGALPENAVLHAELIGQDADGTEATDAVAAELDNAGLSYDGFVALDIYFTAGADSREEVEPAEPVSVRFTLPEGLLPEEADTDSLTVQHLAEDENGQVKSVETVADTAEASEGTVTVEAEAAELAEAGAAAAVEDTAVSPAVTAEFTVEGFSWFTITYNKENAIFVHLVDEEGQDLWGGEVSFADLSTMYSPTDFANKFIGNQWISIEELAGTWASKTEGYIYQAAYRDHELQNEIIWIRYNTTGNTYTKGWKYSGRTDKPSGTSGSGSLNALYLVYTPVTETVENDELSIQETVKEDGSLQAVYSGEATDGLYYVWEKSEDGSQWNTINRLKMNGDQYNLTENGVSLNVALEVTNDMEDAGGQWFRVSVYASEEAYQNHQEPIATSAVMQLEYYDELRNGSFEEPVVSDLGTTNGNYQYPNGTDGLIWQTTGTDQQIEIVDATSSSSDKNYYTTNAADGRQFAELNAEAAGALYQDVLTVPGTSLNWQLYHRGRGSSASDNGEDTMYLLIAPTSEVEHITTQEDLEQLIEQIQHNGNGYGEEDGFYLYEISDDNNSWRYYSSNTRGADPYEVPEGQYLTRFFFVAGETAAQSDNGATLGNLLDDVRFTTELLPAQSGRANLTITKRVEGISATDMESYTVSVEVKGSGVEETVTLGSEGYPFRPQSDGSYVAQWDISDIQVGANQSVELTVTENPGVLSSYNRTGSTVSVNDAEAVEGTSGTISLEERESGTVAFTNVYTAKEPPAAPEHHKEANLITEGENAGNYELSLDVVGSSETISTTSDLNVLMIIDCSASMNSWIGTVKTAAKGLIDSLEANEALGTISYDIIRFSEWNSTYTALEWNTDSETAKGKIDDITIPWSAGTNWQAAIREAVEDLGSQPSDAKTCVIFFTDGAPTYYIANWNGHEDEAGTGSSTDSSYVTAAAGEATNLKADYFFGIGAFNEESSTNKNRLEQVINAGKASIKDTLVASDADELLKAFDDIAGSITNGYSNVTISDELSEYVDFVLNTDEAPQFSIRVTNAEGEDVTEEEVEEGVIRVVYNKESPKQFKLDFADDYQLKDGYTYTISVIIAPNQTAKDYYAQYGSYPEGMTGEEATGTHSEQDGFYSNAEGEALLTYHHTTWEGELQEEYDKPVVQVKTASLIIKKAVDGLPSGTTVNTSYTFSIDGPDSLNGEINGITFTNGNATVQIQGTGQKSIEGLPAGTYIITEVDMDKIPDVTGIDEATYYFAGVKYGENPEETQIEVTLAEEDSQTVEITNIYEPYKTVTITKQVSGDMGSDTDVFAFTTTIQRGEENSVSVSETTVQNGQITLTGSGEKVSVTLTQKETLDETEQAHFTDTGYTLSAGETITISGLKSGDLICIAEPELNSTGYTVTWSALDENNQTVDVINGQLSVPNADVAVTVLNNRNVVTPTGLEDDPTTPYTLMLTFSAFAGMALVGGLLAQHRRVRRER